MYGHDKDGKCFDTPASGMYYDYYNKILKFGEITDLSCYITIKRPDLKTKCG